MGLVSEYFGKEAPFNVESECLCCGQQVKFGGVYMGGLEIVICADCTAHDNLRPLGILLGDAVLDRYKRGFAIDKEYTTIIVRSILQRLESAIYRTIADGLYNRYVRGSRNGREA